MVLSRLSIALTTTTGTVSDGNSLWRLAGDLDLWRLAGDLDLAREVEGFGDLDLAREVEGFGDLDLWRLAGDLDLAREVEGCGDLDLWRLAGDLDLAREVEGCGDLDLVLTGWSTPIPLRIKNSINGFLVNFDQFLRPLARAISFN
jgi:hypothetical protein